MAVSIRLRVLTLVAEALRTIPGIGRVGLDLRAASGVSIADLPAVFVVEQSGGDVLYHPSGRIKEDLLFALEGYVLGEEGDPDGVAVARGTLYQAALNALLGATLRERLVLDMQANGGNGCELIQHTSGPDVDTGAGAPYGGFRLPCRAVLHYARGAI